MMSKATRESTLLICRKSPFHCDISLRDVVLAGGYRCSYNDIQAMIRSEHPREVFTMKSVVAKVTCALLLASGSAWAEIYETTDSEGNKVFTDSPTGAAEVVDLPKANIADSVEPAPPAAPAPARATTTPSAGHTKEAVDDGVYIIGNQRNDRLEEEIARQRRHDVIDGEARKEVLGTDAEAVQHKEGAVARPHRAVPHRR